MIATRNRILTPLRPDEAGARRDLRAQIVLLEEQLAAYPSGSAPAGAPPRLLGTAELEAVRDELVERVARARHLTELESRAQERARRRAEELMLHPEAHPWERVSNEEMGEPGCRHVHVVPRLGFLGKWWRVRVSSGCP